MPCFSALGNVISALTETKSVQQRSHIPYRDSKLTRLLEDRYAPAQRWVVKLSSMQSGWQLPHDTDCEHLTGTGGLPRGSSHTVQSLLRLLWVSQSLSTLKFANRAKNLKNDARVNE